MAPAVPPPGSDPHRSVALDRGGLYPVGGGSPTHGRALASGRSRRHGRRRGGPFRGPADGGGGFGGADASPQRGGGAGGLLGAGAVGGGRSAGGVGAERTDAGGGDGGGCGPSGPSRFGEGHLGLAAAAQWFGRVAGGRLRDAESDADVSGVGRADEAPPGDRASPVHPGHGVVRSRADGHLVRSDQHLLRRGGPPINPRPNGGTRRTCAATAGC